MTQQTLVGQTVVRQKTQVEILKIVDNGEAYLCKEIATGRKFLVLRDQYDALFLTPKKPIKPKGHKGRHKTGKQHYGLQNNISL